MVRVLSALLVLTAPQSPRDELLAADRAAARLSDVLAEDVVFLHPRSPVLRSRSAARPFADSLRHAPVFAAVSADGRFGYTWGATTRDTLPGKYLACWRKEEGGSWRIAAFVHNSAGPGEAPRGWGETTPGRRPGIGRDANVVAADSAFARLSTDSGAPVAFAAYAAPDGISMAGGAPIRFGREAIRAAFADWPAGASLAWAPIWGEAAGAGDLGCTVGVAEFRSSGPPGGISYSKYLTVWRRQGDDTWKFAADAGNPRPAPTR
jgi:ketosteroid isomerase-like protein